MNWFFVLKYAFIPVALLASSIIYKKWPKVKPDNYVEELIEKVMYDQTGLDIDLSQGSPEKEEEDGEK